MKKVVVRLGCSELDCRRKTRIGVKNDGGVLKVYHDCDGESFRVERYTKWTSVEGIKFSHKLSGKKPYGEIKVTWEDLFHKETFDVNKKSVSCEYGILFDDEIMFTNTDDVEAPFKKCKEC